MNDVAIRIENLGKLYKIGGKQAPYRTLRDTITDIFASPFIKTAQLLSGKTQSAAGLDEEIWALKDISFEVKHGEVLGIIGRNGAGKSTLLKILSRITEPTEGYAEINGRVGSLLEVGTGFHPELSGRENIYLNGAILGMSKKEIERKFDEIVDFAEIDKFIDTPVKHYSSGMYVRLAFAVAAHMEPEILVVDEVLAVGDMQFQEKCLGKMKNVANNKRTVLFVSHNLSAIKAICGKVLVLDQGKIGAICDCETGVNHYLRINEKDPASLKSMLDNINSISDIRVLEVRLFQNDVEIGNMVENGIPLEIVIKYQVLKKMTNLRLFIDLCDIYDDSILIRSFHDEKDGYGKSTEAGIYKSRVIIPRNILGSIKYRLKIHAAIFKHSSCLRPDNLIIDFSVVNTGEYNKSYEPYDKLRAKLAFVLKWETEKANNDRSNTN